MKRRADLALLEPSFRAKVEALLADLQAEGIELAIYETVRCPERQRELKARGVSKARPYVSAHQWGLATDFVFKLDTGWSWNEPAAGQWDRFTVLAHKHGLKTLSWEKPHVQDPSFSPGAMGDVGPMDEAGWLAWLADQQPEPLVTDGQAPVA